VPTILRFVGTSLNFFPLIQRRTSQYLGMKVLITAGPTVEPIDPVRYLSNHSSGKMGYAIATAAVDEGFEVILVTGPTDIDLPDGVTMISVRTALEMEAAVKDYLPSCDAGVFTAAVSDYRVAEYSDQKMKKVVGQETLTLELVKNPDILAGARDYFDGVLIGFAAETEQVVENAREKLQRKRVDVIVANDVSREDIGFGSDENQVSLVYADDVVELDLMSKDEVGIQIVGVLQELQQ